MVAEREVVIACALPDQHQPRWAGWRDVSCKRNPDAHTSSVQIKKQSITELQALLRDALHRSRGWKSNQFRGARHSTLLTRLHAAPQVNVRRYTKNVEMKFRLISEEGISNPKWREMGNLHGKKGTSESNRCPSTQSWMKQSKIEGTPSQCCVSVINSQLVSWEKSVWVQIYRFN